MKTSHFTDSDLIPSSTSTEADPSKTDKVSLHLSPSQQEIDTRVEEARQQILELRRQQDELEKVRQELEDLRRRQEEFENGKAEMLEELTRMITRIEQEEFELNQRTSLLASFRGLYADYVRQLQEIRESEWGSDDLKPQLAKAVSLVEAARAEFNKGCAQLDFMGEEAAKLNPAAVSPSPSIAGSGSAPFDFKLEFQRGWARYLPLIIAGAIALILMLIRGK